MSNYELYNLNIINICTILLCCRLLAVGFHPELFRLKIQNMKPKLPETSSSQSRGARVIESEDEHGSSPSVARRALAILQAISATDIPLSAVDLFPMLGFPKPTIHRLMLQLEELGFLGREPGSKRFIAGPALTQMAIDTLIFSPKRAVRHAILQALVDEVQETCNVTTLSGTEIVYIDRVEAHWPLRYHMQVGSRVPIHCSASGRLFLSFMPARKRHALLAAIPLNKYTSSTIVDPDQIEKGLKAIRSTQTSVDDEEFMQGLIGVAVPVFDSLGRICATVSMHAPSLRCSVEKALAFAPALKRAASAIGATLQEQEKTEAGRGADTEVDQVAPATQLPAGARKARNAATQTR